MCSGLCLNTVMRNPSPPLSDGRRASAYETVLLVGVMNLPFRGVGADEEDDEDIIPESGPRLRSSSRLAFRSFALLKSSAAMALASSRQSCSCSILCAAARTCDAALALLIWVAVISSRGVLYTVSAGVRLSDVVTDVFARDATEEA